MSQNAGPLLRREFQQADESISQETAAITAETVLKALAQGGLQAAGCQIMLHGNLGAGKTTWVRAFLRACGITGRIKSQSFSIVESYDTTIGGHVVPIHHLDFYRQSSPETWQAGGLRDLMAEPAILLIEWPERARGLPPADIDVWIDWAAEVTGEAPRRITIAFYQRANGISLAPQLSAWTERVARF